MIAAKDARTLAREILEMSQEEFTAAFRHSPMKRAKLRGLKRNAAVVLGNIGTLEDVPVIQQAIDDPEPLVREHAAWALGQIADHGRARYAHRPLTIPGTGLLLLDVATERIPTEPGAASKVLNFQGAR
ncbi:MAG TPA: HEAT repeat domain-containing protein [Gemmatimonadaceae bacterium]